MKRFFLAGLLCLGATLMASAMPKTDVPRDTSFTPYSSAAKIKRSHPEASLASVRLPKGVDAYEDVVYTTINKTKYGTRELLCDIYRPADTCTYPALIMIYGGGWNSGSKFNQRAMAQRIAAHGYVTIPIEYRLIPEALYPAGLHDVKTAVRWARANAKTYGIDPDKIALSGCSAGAQLATLVGVTNGSKRHEGKGQWRNVSSDVQAVVNMDGISTFITERNLRDVKESYAKKGIEPVNVQWLGGFYEDKPENWKEASALYWITEKSAPICFISSGLPRFSEGRDSLCAIYDSLGIYNERYRIPVDVHPFWFFDPWISTTVDRTTRFLDRRFKPAKTATPRQYLVTDYGVVDNDSTLLQTAAIQAVIDKAEAEGGGVITMPRGKYLSGALFFKPGTKLTLEEGAEIKGSDDIADYPLLPSRMEGRSIYYHAALVNAYFVDGFEINGPGTINGNGFKYWKQFWDNVDAKKKEGKSWTNLEVRRPRVVFLWGCDGARLSGVKLLNSAFWTSHFYLCSDLIIENCYIYAPTKPVKAPSSDAIDLDGCHNVIVRGCYLDCNDDGVCLKGGKGVFAHKSVENDSVTDVLVEGCVFGPNLHGILTLGSECIHADRIMVRNCHSNTNCSVLRLKMRPDTRQIYQNITIENLTGKCGTVIQMRPWKQFFDLEGTKEQPWGTVANILIKNLNIECESLGEIAGNPRDAVDNFVMENINATAKSNKLICNYPNVELINVLVNGKAPLVVNSDGKSTADSRFDPDKQSN